MNVELKFDKSTTDPDETVIMAARGDYMDESLVGKTVEEAMEGAAHDKEDFVAELLRRGHFGPFEHPQAYFAVEDISRVAMAQVTRHRHMSFDVQSQRYVEFTDKDPVVPPSLEDEDVASVLWDHWQDSVDRYTYLLEQDVPKEDARFVLPQATPVNLTFSANIRSLMHFMDLRNNMKAQWEAREFAQQVMAEVKEWAPLSFEGYEEYLNNNSLRAP